MTYQVLERDTSYTKHDLYPFQIYNGTWVAFPCLACKTTAYAHHRRQAGKRPLRFCPACYARLDARARTVYLQREYRRR